MTSRRHARIIPILMSITMVGLTTNATAGLDRSFNSPNGFILHDGNYVYNCFAEDVVVQSDGKIVIVGTAFYREFRNDFNTLFVASYLPDGHLDPTFGRKGVVFFPHIAAASEGYSIARQSDGKILVGGSIHNSFAGPYGGAIQTYTWGRGVLARYDHDGNLDQSFGEGTGYIMSGDLDENWFEQINDVHYQPDGKVLVMSSQRRNDAYESLLLVHRYEHDGSVDWSFGDGDGTFVHNSVSYDDIGSIALQADGGIVLNFSDVVMRLTSDGMVDESFGEGTGYVEINDCSIQGTLIVQPDGKIVVLCGEENFSEKCSYNLTRYNPDGTVDYSFGNGSGVAKYPVPDLFLDYYSLPYHPTLLIQPDGKLVILGYTAVPLTSSLVIRLLNNGLADDSFGVNGSQRYGSEWAAVNKSISGCLQDDGKIVVVGYANTPLAEKALIFRIDQESELDISFGSQMGAEFLGFSGHFIDHEATDVMIQPDGKIVTLSNSPRRTRIIRYNPDGSFDSDFGGGTGEIVCETTDVTMGWCEFDGAQKLLLQPDGKILVLGSRYIYQYGKGGCRWISEIFHIEKDGSGYETLSIGYGMWWNCQFISGDIQSDGKIVALGRSEYSPQNLTLGRFQENGGWDKTFETELLLGPEFQSIDGKLIVLPDDRIHALLSIRYPTGDCKVRLYRLLRDGQLDRSFGGGLGYVVYNSIGGKDDIGSGIFVQPDGRIVIAGTSEKEGISNIFVIRYNPNGTKDLTFGDRGIVLFDEGDSPSCASIGLRSDGKIWLTGSTGVGEASDVLVLRFLSNGALDTTFGEKNGIFTFDGPAHDDDRGRALAVLPNGKAVVAGESFNGGTTDLLTLRLRSE